MGRSQAARTSCSHENDVVSDYLEYTLRRLILRLQRYMRPIEESILARTYLVYPGAARRPSAFDALPDAPIDAERHQRYTRGRHTSPLRILSRMLLR